MSGLDDHNARMNMLGKQEDIVWLDEEVSDTCPTLSYFIDNVVQWHRDRNLIDGSTDKDQVLKLMQELGELSDSVCKGKDIKMILVICLL